MPAPINLTLFPLRRRGSHTFSWLCTGNSILSCFPLFFFSFFVFFPLLRDHWAGGVNGFGSLGCLDCARSRLYTPAVMARFVAWCSGFYLAAVVPLDLLPSLVFSLFAALLCRAGRPVSWAFKPVLRGLCDRNGVNGSMKRLVFSC